MTLKANPLLMPQEPFPCWQFLAASPFSGSNPGSNVVTRGYRFFWARNALYHALKALRISRGARVLLPAYLCKAAVEPFVAYGTEIDFYDVGPGCEPDFSEIAAKVSPRTEAVLAVHYFGFPQKIQEFRELCDRRHLALIEDCAHVLHGEFNGKLLGTFGDASVFSWRKFLAVYDGGSLWLKNDPGTLPIDWARETLPFTLKVAKSLIDRVLQDSPGALARATASGLECLKRVWKWARRAPPDKPFLDLDSNSASFDPKLVDQRMSRVSRWLLRHSDVEAVCRRRRENYLYLQNRLCEIDGIALLHSELPGDTCPWVFPLFFDDLPRAHQLLRKKGIPATAWDFVRPQGIGSTVCPNAEFLYENLVFLPVHQNLTRESLDAILEAVAQVRRSTDARNAQGTRALG